MITLYRANETNFEHNGLGTLNKDCKRSVVEEELNGLYTLTLEYPIKAKFGKVIKNQMVIKSPTPSGNQLFRVYRCEPSMGMLKVTCLHIFYDLAFNMVEDTNIVNKSAQAWLQQLSGATQYSHPFRFFSDIPDVRGSRVVRKNLVEILLDNNLNNSFVSRFGGEIYRDNFTIHLKRAMGENRNYRIIHKKNLLGYKAKIDDSGVVTRVMPIGFDGLLLPEKYVDSPRLGQYPFPRIGKVEFSEVKAAVGEQADDKEAVPLPAAHEKLRTLTRQQFGVIDTPVSSYEVDLIELSKTKEYKDFVGLETVRLGDTVTVDHPEDGFSVAAKVIRYLFDAMLERLEQVELGSFVSRSSTNAVTSQRTIEKEIEEVKEQVNLTQAAANGKNTIYRGTSRPANASVGDLWYEPQGRDVVLKQWSGTDWEILPISDQNFGNININNLSGNAIDIKQFRLSDGERDILFINQDGEVVLNIKHLHLDAKEVATKEDLRQIELTPGPKGDKGESGRDGQRGSSNHLFTTNYRYDQEHINQYGAAGYSGTWVVNESTTGVMAGDTVQMSVYNTSKSGESWILGVVTAVPDQNNLTVMTKGLIDKGDKGQFEGKIGGTNLIPGTRTMADFSLIHTDWHLEPETYRGLSVWSREWEWNGIHKAVMVYAGETYTFSAYVRRQSIGQVYIFVHHWGDDPGFGQVDVPHKLFYNIASDWQRISHTFTATKTGTVIPRVEVDERKKLYTAGYQLEYGNTDTDWSPNPQDLEQALATKADQVLTAQQLNALNERAADMQAELRAKAAADEVAKWIASYQSYVSANDAAKAQAEADFIRHSNRVEAISKDLGGLAEKWNFLDTYMRATNEGLSIGRNDGSSTIMFRPDRISMMSAGTEVMYISQGIIHIENGIFSKTIQIGRFVEMQYEHNPDINVVRYVGGN